MAPRLPTPGGDAGNWGKVLNEFLEVEHQSDGSLKPDGSLSTKYTKPDTGIPKPDLESSVQASLEKADVSLNESQVTATVAGDLVTPGSASRAAVESVATSRSSRGNTTVVFGDSLTKQSGYVGPVDLRDYPNWMMLASNSRIQVIYNAGIGGNNTNDLLARIDSDVIVYQPARCIVLGGTNDFGDGIYETTTTRLEAIYNQIISAGIEVIPATITPRLDLNTAQKLVLHTINAWIRTYAAARGLALFDAFAVAVDPATGGWRVGESTDGLHPNITGAKALGEAAAEQLLPAYADIAPAWATFSDDPTNLITGGVFIGDTNADGTANGWTPTGVGATITRSLVTDAAILGNFQRIKLDAATAGQYGQISQIITTGFAVGDRLIFAGRLAFADLGAGAKASVYVNFTGSTGQSAVGITNMDRAMSGAFSFEAIVPPGTTSLNVRMIVIDGTGTLDVAQLALRKPPGA